MIANNGTGNNKTRDSWETPKELFMLLHNQYKFSFDCCASSKNRKTAHYFDDFMKLKPREVDGTGWMNPPFSKAKEMFVQFFSVCDKGVAIYRCDNLETSIWQDVILHHATWIFIPRGRIFYEGEIGSGARFPSALIGHQVPPPICINGHYLS